MQLDFSSSQLIDERGVSDRGRTSRLLSSAWVGWDQKKQALIAQIPTGPRQEAALDLRVHAIVSGR